MNIYIHIVYMVYKHTEITGYVNKGVQSVIFQQWFKYLKSGILTITLMVDLADVLTFIILNGIVESSAISQWWECF